MHHDAKADNLKPKRRGRKKKDLAERLGPLTWYYAVKSRGWSDPDLDMAFGYPVKSQRPPKEDRKRVFESIHTLGTPPPMDLVLRVDAHPDFRGTAEIFLSLFWKLLLTKPVSLREAKELVNECLVRCHARRLKCGTQPVLQWASEVGAYKRGSPLIDSLPLAKTTICRLLDGRDFSLDLIALVGSLFREAYMAGGLEYAMMYRDEFHRLMEKCRETLWGGAGILNSRHIKDFVIDRVLHWNILPDDSETLFKYSSRFWLCPELIVGDDDPLVKSDAR